MLYFRHDELLDLHDVLKFSTHSFNTEIEKAVATLSHLWLQECNSTL